ncbi:MAG: hypothetical protein WCV55_00240 [Candidatus Paceibacterota bacterium]
METKFSTTEYEFDLEKSIEGEIRPDNFEIPKPIEQTNEFTQSTESSTKSGLQLVVEKYAIKEEDWNMTWSGGGERFEKGEIFDENGSITEKISQENSADNAMLIAHFEMVDHFKSNSTEGYVLPDWTVKSETGEILEVNVTVAFLVDGRIYYETWTHTAEQKESEEDELIKEETDSDEVLADQEIDLNNTEDPIVEDEIESIEPVLVIATDKEIQAQSVAQEKTETLVTEQILRNTESQIINSVSVENTHINVQEINNVARIEIIIDENEKTNDPIDKNETIELVSDINSQPEVETELVVTEPKIVPEDKQTEAAPINKKEIVESVHTETVVKETVKEVQTKKVESKIAEEKILDKEFDVKVVDETKEVHFERKETDKEIKEVSSEIISEIFSSEKRPTDASSQKEEKEAVQIREASNKEIKKEERPQTDKAIESPYVEDIKIVLEVTSSKIESANIKTEINENPAINVDKSIKNEVEAKKDISNTEKKASETNSSEIVETSPRTVENIDEKTVSSIVLAESRTQTNEAIRIRTNREEVQKTSNQNESFLRALGLHRSQNQTERRARPFYQTNTSNQPANKQSKTIVEEKIIPSTTNALNGITLKRAA